MNGCNHNCTNTVGSYYCTCMDGYVLEADNHTCEGEDYNKINLLYVKCYIMICDNYLFVYLLFLGPFNMVLFTCKFTIECECE